MSSQSAKHFYHAIRESYCKGCGIDAQRMGPSTGMPTSPAQGDLMQARWGAHGDHPVIALAPGNARGLPLLRGRFRRRRSSRPRKVFGEHRPSSAF